MKILCSICGKEMEYSEQGMSPGSNEPCAIVIPCCPPEALMDRIGYLEDEEIPEMFDVMTALIDSIDNFMEFIKNENCYKDGKRERQEIEDCQTDLLNRIKDLQSHGIK